MRSTRIRYSGKKMTQIKGTWIPAREYIDEIGEAIRIVEGLLSRAPRDYRDRHEEKQYTKARKWVQVKEDFLEREKEKAIQDIKDAYERISK